MAYSDRHIFFDLDRTLWDFETNSENTLKYLFQELQLHDKIPTFERFHKVYKKKNQALWKQYASGALAKETLRYERFRSTLNHFSIREEDLVHALGDAYVALSPKQTALVPHARTVLNDLQTMGFTLHIITNGFIEVQHVKLSETGLSPYFSSVLCSEEIGVNKPHRAIFDHALSVAHASTSHSLMVGDDYRADVLGAIRAGLQAVWYQSDPQVKSKFENKIHCLTQLPLVAAKLLA